jgi:hypothetical protein
MADADRFAPDLFQPDRGLWVAPIRHHSPACAWAVRALIREVRPAHVLIEGPADLTPLIAAICDPRTRPPVATVTLREGRAAYFPLCDHSPEYVAMRTAEEVGASLRFIDLSSDRPFAPGLPADGPLPLTDDRPFDSGAYVQALCARTGCRDGHELWDHLFESRLGSPDWRGLLCDVGAYCAGLRAATSPAEILARGDAAREAAMAAHIANALTQGPVVAVVGGFHAPALLQPAGTAPKVEPLRDSFLVRYGHAAMDALAGYGAGLPQPGYYAALWQAAEQAAGAPDWSALAASLLQDFAAKAEADGHPLPLPTKVEILRHATGLADLRGRAAVLRSDLFDAVQTAATKGEAGPRDPWAGRLRRHWQGSALGEVAAGQASPPLVADIRRRARAHRLDLSDSLERRRSLDIHRKPSHLATARFLHAVELLGAGLARMDSGPDYSLGLGTDLLFEDWTYAWTPAVETRLVALAAEGRGDTLTAACLATLLTDRDGPLPGQVARLAQGLRAGLGDSLGPVIAGLRQALATCGNFAELGQALRRLYALTRTRGPMRAPEALDLPGLLQTGYGQLIYLADDLPTLPQAMAAPAVAALRLVSDLLASDESGTLDRLAFAAAVARLTRTRAAPEITGAALALALRAGQVPEAALITALRGEFLGVALAPEDRISLLRGLLAAAPDLLWHAPGVLAAVDAFLVDLAEADFLSLLPALRRSFASLTPREADALGGAIADRHGARPDAPAARRFTEADLAAGLAAHHALEAALRADGLLEDGA